MSVLCPQHGFPHEKLKRWHPVERIPDMLHDPRRRSGEGNEALTCITSPISREFSREFSLVVRSSNGPWFCNAPLGHNSLSQMMSLLSVRAKLSTRYTNHFIRASVVTGLKDAGCSNHEVCVITGHQKEGSIQHYDRIDRRGSIRPAMMADVLDGKEAKKPCLAVPLPSTTASLVSVSASCQPSSTIGGIHLVGEAVIHQLTLNYTRSDGETDNKQLCASI